MKANATPQGRSAAISLANDGPDSTPAGTPGRTSASTCGISASVPRSMPLEQRRRGADRKVPAAGGDVAHALRRRREEKEVRAARGFGHVAGRAEACGQAHAGEEMRVAPRRLTSSTTSGSRAHMRTSLPELRTTQAIAVPKAPPPITPIRAIGRACIGMSLTLAIDQGTHASRALVVDDTGASSQAAREIGLVHPQPDWAEQDGEEVVASIFDAMRRRFRRSARARPNRCAGLASQRANCVCWNRETGRALSPIFSWQDRRAHAWIASLEAAHGDAVHRKTGLYLSPHYGASKLRWALDHLPAVREARDAGTLAWGPMASFLAFRLAKERTFAAEPQCAARTQLWNLRMRDWDPALLALFGLPAGFLPRSVPTVHAWGTLTPPESPCRSRR